MKLRGLKAANSLLLPYHLLYVSFVIASSFSFFLPYYDRKNLNDDVLVGPGPARSHSCHGRLDEEARNII